MHLNIVPEWQSYIESDSISLWAAWVSWGIVVWTVIYIEVVSYYSFFLCETGGIIWTGRWKGTHLLAHNYDIPLSFYNYEKLSYHLLVVGKLVLVHWQDNLGKVEDLRVEKPENEKIQTIKKIKRQYSHNWQSNNAQMVNLFSAEYLFDWQSRQKKNH